MERQHKRHAPHLNCADDSAYAEAPDRTATFVCAACELRETLPDDYEAFKMWMAHKDAWFKANPKFAPSVRTLGTIKISKSGKATWLK